MYKTCCLFDSLHGWCDFFAIIFLEGQTLFTTPCSSTRDGSPIPAVIEESFHRKKKAM